MHRHLSRLAFVTTVSLVACGKSEPAPVAAPVEAPPPPPPAPAPPPGPRLLDPPNPNEACGQVIVVAWQGADHADAAITRDKAAAKTRVDQLLARVRGGEAFEAVAAAESDAPSSKIRGGVMGTFAKDEWPDLHMALRDTVFALKVNELAAAAVEAPYGFVLTRRCPVEKAHGAHILIRYTGAKRAPDEMKRTMDEARTIANDIYAKVIAPGADFAKLAKKYSEDGSADNGGDIGSPGRGRLAVPFEQALFGLSPGAVSGVIESEYGFHIITRLPDE